jgi:AmmeMemoRadiSam system protein A
VKESDPRLKEEEGAFVTIHRKGSLRGCIGNILGRQPLYLTIRDMAVAAASEDPRFPPVTAAELSVIDIEISVLSKPKVIKDVSEIKLGTHGVIVSRDAWHYGVFLPQVATETGWTKEEFLSELCSQKAHLPPDAWQDPRTKIEIFSADVFSEKDFR